MSEKMKNSVKVEIFSEFEVVKKSQKFQKGTC